MRKQDTWHSRSDYRIPRDFSQALLSLKPKQISITANHLPENDTEMACFGSEMSERQAIDAEYAVS